MKLWRTLFACVFVAMIGCPFAFSGDGPLLENTTSFVVFPQDCNANPPMAFGGKLLSEMDRCAGITVRRFLYGSPTGAKDAVTVAVESVQFKKAAVVKDLLFVTGKVTGAGRKSVTVAVKIEKETAGGRELIVDGVYIFVAYDLESSKAIEHGLELKK